MAGSNISSDPAVLAAASRCFDTCIPPGAQKAVQTYLWAQIAGITDPAVILTNARCFMSCVPPGGQLTLQAYLTAVLAGGSTDPSTLANAATCFRSCIPPGANGAVITYALANKAGGSTDPSTLANAARCFSSCIPLGFQLAAQNYLIAVAAGLSTDPQVLLSSAGFACFNCNITPGLAGSLIAQSVVTYTVGSLPPCSIPTGLTATWNASGHPASGTVDVSWGAVPAGVSNTEVWFSFDDFTFVLADVVAAPGTTSHTGIIVFDPYVKIRFTINSPATTCSFTAAVRAIINPCVLAVGEMALDTFESYVNGAALDGLQGGTGFCSVGPYVDRTGYLGLLATDDFESYANAAELLGLNGGTGAWNGAYGAENVSVQINANSPNQWPTNGSNTTIVAVASGGFPAYSYQWNKNGVALTNVGHYTGVTTATLTITGYDNTDDASYTVTVTDTTARVYTSLTCTTLVAATNAQLWASLVAQTNSGAWPSQATVSAFDTWDAAVTTAGIKARLYHVNLVAPDSLIAAITPFIHTYGSTLYTAKTAQAGIGTPSVNVNGFISGAAGSDHCTVYHTGVDCSAIPSFTSGNMGLAIYVVGPIGGGTSNFAMGYVSDVAGNLPGLTCGSNQPDGGAYSFNGLDTAGIDITVNIGFNGYFLMGSRTATNVHTLYAASSAIAWGAIGTGNGANVTGPRPTHMGFGGNQNQEGTGHWYGAAYRFSFYAILDGFNSADGQALFNAVQALRVTLGGGFN